MTAVTSARTGATCAMTDLTADKTAAILATTNAIFGRTAEICETTFAMAITKTLAATGAIFAVTNAT